MWEFLSSRRSSRAGSEPQQAAHVGASNSAISPQRQPTSPHSEGAPATPLSLTVAAELAAEAPRCSTCSGTLPSARATATQGFALAAAQHQQARGVVTAPTTPLKMAPEPLQLPPSVSVGGATAAASMPIAVSPTGHSIISRLAPGALTAIDQFGQASVSKRLSKLLSTTVNFRDVQLVTREDHTTLVLPEVLGGTYSAGGSPVATEQQVPLAGAAGAGPGAGPVVAAEGAEPQQYTVLATAMQKTKLVVILVGMRATGKSFLSNKMARYLCWLGHPTRQFQVKESLEAPEEEEKFVQTVDELCNWLGQEDAQVAILDATNRTEARRQYLRSRFHGRWMYILVETVCNDDEVRKQNLATKIQTEHMPEYQGVELDKAVADLRERVAQVERRYETLKDRAFHFIKLTDMPTGRSNMDINRVSGYLQGRLVFFLMQVCKAGQMSPRRIFLTRHGQSEYNCKEQLGGDSSISEGGECYAALLPAALLSRLPEGEGACLSVWTSTLKRAIQTARRLPFPKLKWKALDEINAGICDGMTYEQIAETMPEEYAARKRDKLRYRYPEGESYLDVIQRLEPVITEVERGRESVCIVSHQAVLRVLYGYMMGVPQDKIPTLEIPLHTLIELTPQADGTMHEQRWPVNIAGGLEQFPKPSPAAADLLSKLYRHVSLSPPPARTTSDTGSETTCVGVQA